MNEVETRRRVPAAVLALICVSILGLFQLLLLTGAYKIDAGTVRKIAPFLYNPFRKMVGEDPSTRPQTADARKETSREAAIETVTGIKPEELSVKLDVPEVDLPAEPPVEAPAVVPAPEPEAPNPLDSDEPVG